ncbi:MAG: zinc ribbon domain-containing protein [Candidatus Lokiarchaeota archaeon]|nr:zinc ribbon domain-containing protein [Candidatus Lokiarchaeota archaeon]
MPSKYCMYCGNPIKDSDKFCIICGKPVLRDLPDTHKQEPKPRIKPQRQEILPKEDTVVEFVDDSEEELEIKEEKKEKKKDKKGDLIVEKPLPYEVKEQMILYIEFNDIQLNKELLITKLKDLQKSLKDPAYEYDESYKESANVKLEAIKTFINEMKQKESDLKDKMDDPFIVQRIKSDMDTKIFQLKNLTKEFKLHKVDKDSFETLRDKYKQEKEELEQEREDLISGMSLWIKELKLEKVEAQSERNLNKGRFSSKEITQDDFNSKDKELELKVKKINVKIKTLEKLVK